MTRFLRAPLDDYTAAIAWLLPTVGWRGAALVFASAALAWWIYVPIHELAHAYGCILGGGEVTRLEIDAIYGAEFLKRFFPFVAVGSEYAGQLTGFDTGGSDVTYLLTDFAPFLLTILVGVPLLRFVPAIENRSLAAIALGTAVPVAYAPMISLPGDYYEMGAILVSRVAASLGVGPVERWRSDDVVLLVETLSRSDGAVLDWVGIGAATFVGFVLAWMTYSAGTHWATALQKVFPIEADTSE